MNDWRSDPPDVPGWWLWRAKPSSEPFRVRINKRHTVTVSDYRCHVIWPPTELAHFVGGQWFKVPE